MGVSAATLQALQSGSGSRRPSLFRLVAVSLALAFAGVLLTHSHGPGRSLLTLPVPQAFAREPAAALARQSCEVCRLDPFDPLCEYGEHNIRLSRAFEGSGHRLQRFLDKVLAGEEVNVGVLGASITAGHSVPPGNQTWQDRWFEGFQHAHPNVKMHVGAIGATDSQVRARAVTRTPVIPTVTRS